MIAMSVLAEKALEFGQILRSVAWKCSLPSSEHISSCFKTPWTTIGSPLVVQQQNGIRQESTFDFCGWED